MTTDRAAVDAALARAKRYLGLGFTIPATVAMDDAAILAAEVERLRGMLDGVSTMRVQLVARVGSAQGVNILALRNGAWRIVGDAQLFKHEAESLQALLRENAPDG